MKQYYKVFWIDNNGLKRTNGITYESLEAATAEVNSWIEIGIKAYWVTW